jgi:LemA protein
MTGVLILLGVLFAVFMIVMGMYNGLVTARNLVKNAFAQIDVQLKRRYDLIPNLVEVAKKYMGHEKDTFEAVVKARNAAVSSQKAVSADPSDGEAVEKLNKAEGEVSNTLGRLLMLTENYPELKADSTMNKLTEELTSTENKVSFARQHYNDAVMAYNNKREVFPGSIIAGMFNFKASAYFEIENAVEKEAVKVQF